MRGGERPSPCVPGRVLGAVHSTRGEAAPTPTEPLGLKQLKMG